MIRCVRVHSRDTTYFTVLHRDMKVTELHQSLYSYYKVLSANNYYTQLAIL